ncbi:hypothetical protein GAO09_20575 [Rhizobiales bacterium RZME27]|uniref:SWIM-type domain-containing protein n=1 Tax=Endobacterium cereale TaxID=2663029 RepID=A0A6A8AB48_9HYPH|nr:hypothetical protein [Endobacterium cereale]
MAGQNTGKVQLPRGFCSCRSFQIFGFPIA